MKKLSIIGIICIMLCALTLVGCVESYNTKAIDTDTDGIENVTSNGGLAVKAGKYLFYINGYAGNEVDNVFGDVQKGAIGRVEINDDGTLNMATNQIVVPKNVYNTEATSGLYIDGEYIYYSTYSIAKDGDGEIKSDNMWLMRTKVDGTDTAVVAEFEDFTAEYKVANGYAMYYLEDDDELHTIDLGSKKFKDTVVDDEVTSVLFTTFEKNANDFTDAVFYVKASEDENASNNVVYCYRAGGEAKEVIDGKDGYGTSLLYAGGYSLTLKESKYVGEKVRLIYTKTDSGTNAISGGTYSYDFDDALRFVPNAEKRYTYDTTLSSLYFLEDGSCVAIQDTDVVWYKELSEEEIRANNANIKDINNNIAKFAEKAVLIEASTAPTILDVEERADGVVRIYYITSDNYIFGINVLKKANGVYEKNITAAESLYSGPYDTTWLEYDKVDGNVYFFNEDVLDYTYYVTLENLKSHNADSQVPTLLSLVTEEDEITMLTESEDDD